MTSFIEQQQELARKELGEPAEGYSHYNVDGCTVEQLIEQAITNTGAELLRFVEEGQVYRFEDDDSGLVDLDTLKKHITELTGVE